MSKEDPKFQPYELECLIGKVISGEGTRQENDLIFDLVEKDSEVAELYQDIVVEYELIERAVQVHERNAKSGLQKDTEGSLLLDVVEQTPEPSIIESEELNGRIRDSDQSSASGWTLFLLQSALYNVSNREERKKAVAMAKADPNLGEMISLLIKPSPMVRLLRVLMRSATKARVDGSVLQRIRKREVSLDRRNRINAYERFLRRQLAKRDPFYERYHKAHFAQFCDPPEWQRFQLKNEEFKARLPILKRLKIFLTDVKRSHHDDTN